MNKRQIQRSEESDEVKMARLYMRFGVPVRIHAYKTAQSLSSKPGTVIGVFRDCLIIHTKVGAILSYERFRLHRGIKIRGPFGVVETTSIHQRNARSHPKRMRTSATSLHAWLMPENVYKSINQNLCIHIHVIPCVEIILTFLM
jgi:hypothetical protein